MSETAEQAKAELRLEAHSKRPRRQWIQTRLCACGWCWRRPNIRPCPQIPNEGAPPADAVWLWSSEAR